MTLRWGILGTARINRLVIPAIRASARSALVAVASRDESRGRAYAADWDIPRVASYEGLLADPDIDIVYVSLPNSLHAPWTLRAVEAGKHVLCEKPLAVAVSDVDAVTAAATDRRVVAEGFMYRHHAQTARIATLVSDGAIGALRTIASAFTFQLNRPGDVRLEPALGGGSLWDVGCYPVSLAQCLAGAPPAQVSGWQQTGASGVDETFAGTVVYANGVACQFHCGFRAAYQTFLRLAGTEGLLVVDRPFRPEPHERLTLHRDGSVEQIDVEGSAIFVDEIADIEDAVLGVRPPRISLADSRMHIATIEALYRSARDSLVQAVR